jgi:hypothetical protein
MQLTVSSTGWMAYSSNVHPPTPRHHVTHTRTTDLAYILLHIRVAQGRRSLHRHFVSIVQSEDRLGRGQIWRKRFVHVCRLAEWKDLSAQIQMYARVGRGQNHKCVYMPVQRFRRIDIRYTMLCRPRTTRLFFKLETSGHLISSPLDVVAKAL